MPIPYNLKKDIRYQQGYVVGLLIAKRERKLAHRQIFIIAFYQLNKYTNEEIAETSNESLAFVIRTLKAYQKGLAMAQEHKYTVKKIARDSRLMQMVVERLILK